MSEFLSVCLAGDPPVGGAPRGASCPAHMDFPASLLLVDFGQFRSQAQAKPDRGETNAMELMNGDVVLALVELCVQIDAYCAVHSSVFCTEGLLKSRSVLVRRMLFPGS